VGLENDVAFVVRHEGLDLGAVLAVALAEVDATAHLVRVVGRGAVAEGVEVAVVELRPISGHVHSEAVNVASAETSANVWPIDAPAETTCLDSES
jgi:hypothetical protein